MAKFDELKILLLLKSSDCPLSTQEIHSRVGLPLAQINKMLWQLRNSSPALINSAETSEGIQSHTYIDNEVSTIELELLIKKSGRDEAFYLQQIELQPTDAGKNEPAKSIVSSIIAGPGTQSTNSIKTHDAVKKKSKRNTDSPIVEHSNKATGTSSENNAPPLREKKAATLAKRKVNKPKQVTPIDIDTLTEEAILNALDSAKTLDQLIVDLNVHESKLEFLHTLLSHLSSSERIQKYKVMNENVYKRTADSTIKLAVSKGQSEPLSDLEERILAIVDSTSTLKVDDIVSEIDGTYPGALIRKAISSLTGELKLGMDADGNVYANRAESIELRQPTEATIKDSNANSPAAQTTTVESVKSVVATDTIEQSPSMSISASLPAKKAAKTKSKTQITQPQQSIPVLADFGIDGQTSVADAMRILAEAMQAALILKS